MGLPKGEGHDPIDADGEPTMRRRPVLQGFDKVPELGLDLLLLETEESEEPVLHILSVDSDRS